MILTLSGLITKVLYSCGEACVELHGSLLRKEQLNLGCYRRKLLESTRTRAGVDPDFNKTIAATDYTKEDDWAIYSAGQPVIKTLYNIRRERR